MELYLCSPCVFSWLGQAKFYLHLYTYLETNRRLSSFCRSQCLRGLRPRSAVARLLRFGFESRRGMDLCMFFVLCFQVGVPAKS